MEYPLDPIDGSGAAVPQLKFTVVSVRVSFRSVKSTRSKYCPVRPVSRTRRSSGSVSALWWVADLGRGRMFSGGFETGRIDHHRPGRKWKKPRNSRLFPGTVKR